jgi:tetratricopeptide (TPR) repeat protein
MSTDEKPVETTEKPAPAADAAPRAQALPAMTPALRRRLQMCFDHAGKLMQSEKYDYGYAGTLLAQCVSNDPGNLVYWDAFFLNTVRQYKANQGGMMLGGLLGGGRTVQALVDKQEYVSAIKAGVEALGQNPYDVDALRAMAYACEALSLADAELRLLKKALDAASKNIEVNRHCAKSLARMGHIDQAIACWHRVESANRDDPEATRAISNLTVQKARIASGIKDEANKQSGGGKAGGAAAAASEKAVSPEAQKKREIKLTPRQQLERLIADRPADLENYFKLADLLLQESRVSEAINILKKALEASGGDIQVRERLEDAELERARVTCVLAEKKAAADTSPAALEQAKKLRSDWNRAELDLIFARAQRYPQKKELRYEMAVRLKRMGNYAEAVKYLDEIVGDEKWIGPASLEMGECYQHLQQYDKAWGAYKIAIKSLFEAKDATAEMQEHRKLALYRAGVLATGLKKADRAVQFLERLVKLDPHYKDAAARLDKARHLGDKG